MTHFLHKDMSNKSWKIVLTPQNGCDSKFTLNLKFESSISWAGLNFDSLATLEEPKYTKDVS